MPETYALLRLLEFRFFEKYENPALAKDQYETERCSLSNQYQVRIKKSILEMNFLSSGHRSRESQTIPLQRLHPVLRGRNSTSTDVITTASSTSGILSEEPMAKVGQSDAREAKMARRLGWAHRYFKPSLPGMLEFAT
jgi:hypothetical protein